MTTEITSHLMEKKEALDESQKKHMQVMANTIRVLSMDAVQRAGSGHAGTPMGCAEIGAYLYSHFLKYNPHNPKWLNRDRFILSAGHASMLQYACLHLSGYNLTLDDLKNFRQLNSKTPSHPQYGTTEGVETTTGVDGQGIAHGVGQALGLKLLSARFNRAPFSLFNAKVVVIAGDGCLMEGISHEVCSFAGHLNLNNLILIYDRNKTSLDGFVSESSSENTKQRFLAYGWNVCHMNGHDFDSIHSVFLRLRDEQKQPTLVIADTIIGKGAPTKAGTHFIHSNPIGQEETHKAKQEFGFPNSEFYVPKEVYAFFSDKRTAHLKTENAWDKAFCEWKNLYPEQHFELQNMESSYLPPEIEKELHVLQIPDPISGRKASNYVLSFLANHLPGLYGGSADLGRSDMTHMEHFSDVSSQNFLGRNIKFGVREFGMAGIAIGLAQTEKIRPFIGTFLAFSDYMSNAIRMAALMKVPVIYQLTHDSIFIGQDGPTHQPVEHLAYLRSIPNLQVIRPADANEVKMAWLAALKYVGPTAIILSRQDLALCKGTDKGYHEGLGRGAYVIKEGERKLDFTLLATGSEVALALEAAAILENKEFSCRVVSMPNWKLFEEQSDVYKDKILGKNSGKIISIESGSEVGWHKYVLNGIVISLNSFGKSARAADLANDFGFTVEKIVHKIQTAKL